MKTYTQHEIAKLFTPPLTEQELGAYEQSIIQNGLIDEVVLCDGKILDKWHGYQLALKHGKEIRFREFHKNGVQSPKDFVIAKLQGRHLNQTQKACIAAMALDGIVKDPKECVAAARAAGTARGGRPKKGVVVKKKRGNFNKSRQTVCNIFGVCDHYVCRARTLWLRAKPWFERAKNGELTINQALLRWKSSPEYKPEEMVYNNRVYHPPTEQFINRNEVVIPTPFEPYERIIRFIREMNAAGWILQMKVDKGQFYVHWYGNGVEGRNNSWGGYRPDADFKRAVINEACLRLNKKPEANEAA